MTIPIVIKTYHKDHEWLFWALSSVKRFATGFSDVVVLSEPEGAELIQKAIADSKSSARLVDVYQLWPEAQTIEAGYVRQQYVKLRTPLVFGDQVQIDSDDFLLGSIGPELWGSPPVYYFDPYDDLLANADEPTRGGLENWRTITTEILGWDVDKEFMRCPGFYLRRDGCLGLSEYLEHRHKKSMVEVFRRPLISEYNLYGAFCAAKMSNLHRWERPGQPRPLRKFWSWGGIQTADREWMTEQLR